MRPGSGVIPVKRERLNPPNLFGKEDVNPFIGEQTKAMN
jgi:hypothetical protein